MQLDFLNSGKNRFVCNMPLAGRDNRKKDGPEAKYVSSYSKRMIQEYYSIVLRKTIFNLGRARLCHWQYIFFKSTSMLKIY